MDANSLLAFGLLRRPTYPVCDVIHQDDPVRLLEVVLGQDPKPVVSGRVPNLNPSASSALLDSVLFNSGLLARKNIN